MKVGNILNILGNRIIPSVKWKNDPSGLLVGDRNSEVTGIITALNPTLEVAKEALKSGCNLIVSHHPLFKKPVNDLVDGDYYSDIIRFLIKNDISLISCHTNYDLVSTGVSYLLAKQLGLNNIRPMVKIKEIKDIEVNELYKIVIYSPAEAAEKIMKAVAEAGGASIGNYDRCFFTSGGEGTFRPGEGTAPYLGKKGRIERVPEIRIETVATAWKRDQVAAAAKKAHPYEEPVIDIYPLDNGSENFGLGAVGEFDNEMSLKDFCGLVSEKLGTKTLRIALRSRKEKISSVALCGGSGAALWKNAFRSGAQVFLTSEFGHHLYQEASKYINIVDATHHATEQFAKKGLKEYIDRNCGKSVKVTESKTDKDVVTSIGEI
ncbi:MAG: Nif3-like dinuclear metal center hexameric protein [Candidatus Delongbacteria bacterium]|nr:Nif3-like dinuclear metal center hexameric protein [Candidatus Delongbacteria bacterium]